MQRACDLPHPLLITTKPVVTYTIEMAIATQCECELGCCRGIQASIMKTFP